MQSGATAIDVLGRDGDVDGMLALHAEVVGFLRDLWGAGRVAAEVRLAALVVGHLGTALRAAATRASGRAARPRRPPVRRGRGRVGRRPASLLLLPPTVEGQAWEARATAEQQRAHWAAGEDVPLVGCVDALPRVVDLFVRARRDLRGGTRSHQAGGGAPRRG